jgi:virginiamycin A acetyltransferase
MNYLLIGGSGFIGTNTTITKDIPPYAVVVGNPPKIIKYRFNSRDRERLQKIAWWNLTDEQVTEIAPNLYSDNIDELERIVNGM